jgi:hypothetical protein
MLFGKCSNINEKASAHSNVPQWAELFSEIWFIFSEVRFRKLVFSSTDETVNTLTVFDLRPKFYGRSHRFKICGYGYGGGSLRPFLQSKVLLAVFLVFSKMEAEMCFSLHKCQLRLRLRLRSNAANMAWLPAAWNSTTPIPRIAWILVPSKNPVTQKLH